MSNMKVNVIWAIRDARGLRAIEKSFLWAVASRGVSKSKRDTIMKDAGISNGSITNVVKSLLEKNLITAHPGKWENGRNKPTLYTINEEALYAYTSCMHTGDEPMPTGDEPMPTGDGHKGNSKGNSEGNQAAADAAKDPDPIIEEDSGPTIIEDEKVERFVMKPTRRGGHKKGDRKTMPTGDVAIPTPDGTIDYAQEAKKHGVYSSYVGWLNVSVRKSDGKEEKRTPRGAFNKAMKQAGKEVKA